MLSITQDLSQVANRVNRLLEHDLASERFVTAFIGILDPTRHVIDYVAAGQGPLLFLSSSGSESRPATGIPLAIMDDIEYECASFEFTPGSALVLLTDGFYEAAGADSDLFGEQRVTLFIQKHLDQPLATLINELDQQINYFVGDSPQADDLTAVLIRQDSRALKIE